MIAAFHEKGAVVVRRAVGEHWIEHLRAGLEKNQRDPSPYGCRYTKEGDPGGFWDDYCNWQRIPEYRDFIFDSGVAELVSRILSSETVRIFHEHVLVKEPGTRDVSPWHHDQPYYCVDGEKVGSVWLPLDPVPRSACPEFVAGSHRWGRMFAPRKFVDQKPYEGALGHFEPVPDIDERREDYEILTWDLEPGDVIVFHMKTVHGAPGTTELRTRRRAIATRWLGDDAIFARRPFTTSPPFPDLHLAPGAPFEDERFPVVWPLSARR
ncbi:MAG TPA: phytanoyl-CoA dioxygenase family protein [Vicinamibacteria bacterium]|nr:phytanoyl-CoA dioxygenase family protein [Vicinamibacteria bacterium]